MLNQPAGCLLYFFQTAQVLVLVTHPLGTIDHQHRRDRRFLVAKHRLTVSIKNPRHQDQVAGCQQEGKEQ